MYFFTDVVYEIWKDRLHWKHNLFNGDIMLWTKCLDHSTATSHSRNWSKPVPLGDTKGLIICLEISARMQRWYDWSQHRESRARTTAIMHCDFKATSVAIGQHLSLSASVRSASVDWTLKQGTTRWPSSAPLVWGNCYQIYLVHQITRTVDDGEGSAGGRHQLHVCCYNITAM